MAKVGFLFGAGAEICYGLPTGGKFADEEGMGDVWRVWGGAG